MRNSNLIESFNRAIEGFLHTLRFQRNMRIHFIVAGLVVVSALYLDFTRLELALLVTIVTFVLFAEMLNTIVESLLDIYKKDSDNLIKTIKDISAGSVLLASILAVGVGYLLFFNRVHLPLDSVLVRIKQSEWHISLIILILLFFLVVTIKYYFRRGSPLRGGIPSGHSAFAFSVWTITFLLQKNNIVNFLVFLLAVLIARSRIKTGIHNIYETVIGAILGIVITILIYQLMT
ncbi:MAG: diacylglycerol kinase [Candidatus Omnitrophica bacterium]|nr:diacylglycerol kinase [Candidatus Omnitrophota bacterium]